jgi:hypothetical protein
MNISKAPATISAICGLFLLPTIASADLGSCQFRIHSAATGRDILVCQSANNVSDCGTWPHTPASNANQSYAEGKAEGDLQFSNTECDVDHAVGACLLPNNTKIFFYEGAPQSLAIGCGRMQGEWKDVVNNPEAERLLNPESAPN